MKGIDGGYKLSELLLGRGGSADAIDAAPQFLQKLTPLLIVRTPDCITLDFRTPD